MSGYKHNRNKPETNRNKIPQIITYPHNGARKIIFHNKPFRAGNWKEFWDLMNKTKRKGK